ncbi:MarR family winged helix-turn-helix transcriptional regulator [Streptomyces sp. 796.1]|uniref:MarR family winged helix-turn-helix transcriptional regulator n=1 Tax=Streptomyces sp. 796.1 TaxID=3163029 RepID=UPI0039C97881
MVQLLRSVLSGRGSDRAALPSPQVSAFPMQYEATERHRVGEWTVPKEYTDEELLKQPVGYWTGVAQRLVVDAINETLGTLGIRQPHWWVLNLINRSADGLTREELPAGLRHYVSAEAIATVADDLLQRGWVHVDESQRLHLTPEGTATLARLWELVPVTLSQVRAGFTDAEFIQLINLLRRVVDNLGGRSDLD